MEATIPYNGSGTFSRLYSWVVDAANSVNISSSRTDAEMNGFAAGLTNCITRDGQSPPSADLPMGGKKLVNLGLATTATDALSQAAGDARYILSSVTSLTLTGALNAATITTTGAATIGGGMSVAGPVMTVNTNLLFQHNGTDGFVRTQAGILNLGAGGNNYLAISAAGAITQAGTGAVTFGGAVTLGSSLTVTGGATIGGPVMTLNTNLLFQHNGTDGFVRTQSGILNLGAGGSNWLQIGAAGAISQVGTGTVTFNGQTNLANVTGTPNGTAVNGLGFMGVPSTVKTANYSLAASDIGQDITFNGASLTCTIPAGLPNGYVAIIANINASALTITSASDTLTWSGTSSTGNRTLGQNGEARIIRRNGVLYIGGTALS